MKAQISFILLVLLFSSKLMANATYDGFAGTIPLDYSRPIANDLYLKDGTKIFDTNAEAIRSEYKRLYGTDLHTVEPKHDKFYDPQKKFQVQLKEVPLNETQVVEFVGELPSMEQSLTFQGRQGNGLINFDISLDNHNFLLRHALLKKLGYRVPNIKWVPKVRIKFKSLYELKRFRYLLFPPSEEEEPDAGIRAEAGAYSMYVEHPDRWIISEDEQNLEIVLQDIVASNPNDFTNIAVGIPQATFNKQKRSHVALLIAYALVQCPESINLCYPHIGKKINNYIGLEYPHGELFYPSLEDAKWMARKILSLSESELKGLARDGVSRGQESHLPKEVEMIRNEILIERRDSLIDLFNLKGFKKYRGDLDISHGKRLVDGKLIPKTKPIPEDADEMDIPESLPWQGRASRYAYGDPKSPLSLGEYVAFGKSIVQSNVIKDLVSRFNDKFLYETDIKSEVQEKQMKRAYKNFKEYVSTGKAPKTEFGIDVIPTIDGDLIASRDIVFGSYLGADNRIQLADTIGFSVKAGARAVAYGLPGGWFLNASADAYLTRTYTHLKPVTSIKKALKTEFEHIIVPFYKNKVAKLFKNLDESDQKYLESKEGIKELQSFIEEFNNTFQVGESLIISLNVGAGLSLGGGYGFNDILNAQANFSAQQRVLWRTHILRQKNGLQIYRDFGHKGTLTARISLNARNIPIISFDFKAAKGGATTSLNTLDMPEIPESVAVKAGTSELVEDIETEEQEAQEETEVDQDALELTEDEKTSVRESIAAVRMIKYLFKHHYYRKLEIKDPPYVFSHDFTERGSSLSFLFLRSKYLNTTDDLTFAYPTGEKRHFFRQAKGRRSGKNFEALFTDGLNYLIDEMFEDSEFNVSTTNNGDPGNTIFGSGTTEQIIFEVEKTDGEVFDPLAHLFANVSYTKKGWSEDHDGALEILDKMNERYKHDFFPKNILARTEKHQLYSVSIDINFYKDAFLNFINMDDETLTALIRDHADRSKMKSVQSRFIKNRTVRNKDISVRSLRGMLNRYRSKMKEAYYKQDAEKLSKYYHKYLSVVTKVFSLEGMARLAGNTDSDLKSGKIINMYAFGNLAGFRKGDERGFQPYASNNYGEIGDQYYMGPMRGLRDETKITESELLIRWIMDYL
ncbi:MAG: hypothetical protein ACPGJV_00010 [Bacteriovoracaceae bacterium]